MIPITTLIRMTSSVRRITGRENSTAIVTCPTGAAAGGAGGGSATSRATSASIAATIGSASSGRPSWIAARMAGHTPPALPRWLRFGGLFVLAFYGLLLVFDGRYRDFPLGLFMLPCVGHAMAAWLSDRREWSMPPLEERFLAVVVPVLAAVVLVQEAGMTPVAWLWLGLSLLIALPVLAEWWCGRPRLQSQQA